MCAAICERRFGRRKKAGGKTDEVANDSSFLNLTKMKRVWPRCRTDNVIYDEPRRLTLVSYRVYGEIAYADASVSGCIGGAPSIITSRPVAD